MRSCGCRHVSGKQTAPRCSAAILAENKAAILAENKLNKCFDECKKLTQCAAAKARQSNVVFGTDVPVIGTPVVMAKSASAPTQPAAAATAHEVGAISRSLVAASSSVVQRQLTSATHLAPLPLEPLPATPAATAETTRSCSATQRTPPSGGQSAHKQGRVAKTMYATSDINSPVSPDDVMAVPVKKGQPIVMKRLFVEKDIGFGYVKRNASNRKQWGYFPLSKMDAAKPNE